MCVSTDVCTGVSAGVCEYTICIHTLYMYMCIYFCVPSV